MIKDIKDYFMATGCTAKEAAEKFNVSIDKTNYYITQALKTKTK